MANRMLIQDDRLFLPSLQAPDTDNRTLRMRVAELERLQQAAQEEIDLLTAERDELVGAIKQWARADRLERQDLLFEASTQDMRSELKLMRGKVKRLERENAALRTASMNGAPRRMSA
jgi:multidrug resistance efflux pump